MEFSQSRKKHVLENEWTYFYLIPESTKKWQESIINVDSFKTIEDFFSISEDVFPTTDVLSCAINYHVFKKGIMPTWEDRANSRGHRWSIFFERNYDFSQLKEQWIRLVLAIIREKFEPKNCINGASLQYRRRGRSTIFIWMKHRAENLEEIHSVGIMAKWVMKYSLQKAIVLETHDPRMKYNGHGRVEHLF